MRKDFFISRTGADKGWAEWVAWQLDEAGYSVVLQDWDFRPGQNFVVQMDQAAQVAKRTIAILSPNYLTVAFTAPEWAAAFVSDPKGEEGRLIPVRVRECVLDGLLKAVIYIDLVGMSQEDAKERLLNGIKLGPAKPLAPPAFPGERPRVVPQQPRFPGALPPVWNVPHLRNRNFIGREDLLKELRSTLESGQHAAVTQAITGLGGVGKTQLAMEYAFRHTGEYDLVWWMRAEEPATLAVDYAQLATELALPARDLPAQSQVIAGVRRWLGENGGWLLVFDNVDSSEEIRPYLPQSITGHVLITSRNPNWMATALALPVPAWEREETVEFLCRRIKQTDKAIADELAKELGDLPLALEQAAAYMETTGRTMADYLDLFRHYNLELMKGDRPPEDYKATVTTTWKLAFERVQAASPTGADMLRLCAFLAPDHIPKEILTNGREWLPERLVAATPIEFDRAVAVLRRYSLLNVDNEGLSLHRLVQAVQRDEMTGEERHDWAETALRFVNGLSDSYRSDMRMLRGYLRLLPHVLVATGHAERFLGPEHPDVATSLNNLALLYYTQGRYDQAEPLLMRTLAIREKVLRPEHPDVAQSLNNLAVLYHDQGKYDQAEPLYQHALVIREKVLGPEHPGVVATFLSNLASLYHDQGKYDQAEPLHQRALAIREKVLGPKHPDVTQSLNNLASLYRDQGKYDQAEPLHQRALSIGEKALGPEHPNLATFLDNLAGLYYEHGQHGLAEPLHLRALAIREKVLGPEHPDVAQSLNNLASLYRDQEEYDQAEPLHQRALAIREKVLGPEHPDVAQSLNNLAVLYHNQGRYDLAEPLLQRALTIVERLLGPEHPHVATSLNNLASLYSKQGKHDLGEPLYQRVLDIRIKVLGPEHPDTATPLNNLAALHLDQGRHDQAAPLFERALDIVEKALGPEHPNVATILNNLAGLYRKQGKHDLAEPLHQRALAIQKKISGLQETSEKPTSK